MGLLKQLVTQRYYQPASSDEAMVLLGSAAVGHRQRRPALETMASGAGLQG